VHCALRAASGKVKLAHAGNFYAAVPMRPDLLSGKRPAAIARMRKAGIVCSFERAIRTGRTASRPTGHIFFMACQSSLCLEKNKGISAFLFWY
jgi:hypothetical protein